MKTTRFSTAMSEAMRPVSRAIAISLSLVVGRALRARRGGQRIPRSDNAPCAPEPPRASSPSPPHTCGGEGWGEEAPTRFMGRTARPTFTPPVTDALRAIWFLPGVILLGVLLAAFGAAAADLPRNQSVSNAPIPKLSGTPQSATVIDRRYTNTPIPKLGGTLPDSAHSADATSNAPVPKRGGTLRLALPTDLGSLDPALAFDAISEPFLMLLYQGLVEYRRWREAAALPG